MEKFIQSCLFVMTELLFTKADLLTYVKHTDRESKGQSMHIYLGLTLRDLLLSKHAWDGTVKMPLIYKQTICYARQDRKSCTMVSTLYSVCILLKALGGGGGEHTKPTGLKYFIKGEKYSIT